MTRSKLLSITITSKPSLRTLGSFFKSSRRFGGDGESILCLLHRGRSPARVCIEECIAQLRDETADCWAPLLGCSGWSEVMFVTASVPMMQLTGAVYKRFIVVLDCWPWRLAILCDPSTSEEEKQLVADMLERAQVLASLTSLGLV